MPTPTDPMPILFDMNGKLSAMQAQMGNIQLQLATDKAEHKAVHETLNAKIEAHEARLDAFDDAAKAQKVTLRNVQWAVGGTGSVLGTALAIGGDNIRAFVGHLF